MSGGSMDYLYRRVLDADFSEDTPLRKAFKRHLVLIAEALRAIEWNESGDGDEREEERIRACVAPGSVLDACIEQAHEASKNLRAELERACAGTPRARKYLHGVGE